MIVSVTMAFQNAATTGDGLTQFLLEPRTVTFRVTGNGSVSAGAVTIECCPSMTPTPLPGSGAGSGTTWTSLTTIIVPGQKPCFCLQVARSCHSNTLGCKDHSLISWKQPDTFAKLFDAFGGFG